MERRNGSGGNDEDDDEDNNNDRARTMHHMPLEVGSVTVNNGWMLHCADAAAAGDDRYAPLITYFHGQVELRENVLVETTITAKDDK